MPIILRNVGVSGGDTRERILKNLVTPPLVATAPGRRNGFRGELGEGPVDPDPVDPGTVPTPDIYHETWASKDFSAPNDNGFSWGNQNGTGIVGIEPNPESEFYGESVYYWDGNSEHHHPDRDYTPKVGDYALRFQWTGPDDDWSEQKFDLGGVYDPDLWISYWVRVPDNYYAHMHEDKGAVLNNKWLSVEQDGYSQDGDGGHFVMEFRPSSAGDGSAYLYFMIRNQDAGGERGGNYQNFENFMTPADQGRWMHLVVHLRIESATDAGDGVVETWRRWEDESEYTKMHEWLTAPIWRSNTGSPIGWQKGYFLGWTHAYYLEPTWFLMDDIKFSTQNLLPSMEAPIDPSDPGVDVYYLPETLRFIAWDFPNVVYPGIDIDYKLTGYDWFNTDLQWTIEDGPTGMTIDPDGRLHWTPDTDGTTREVTVGLTFGGGEKLTKTFTISVDSSRCLFAAVDGSDSTGDGSLASPFASYSEELFEAVNNIAPQGATVYFRGGNYIQPTRIHYHDWSTHPEKRSFNERDYSIDDPMLVRNYPGEVPIIDVSGAGINGPRTGGDYTSIHGLTVTGGHNSNNANFQCGNRGTLKRCIAKDYDVAWNHNPTGILYGGGALLDQCFALDNYDRADPSHHNSSNYLFFGTSGSEKRDAFVIECISEGQSATGFKVKHSGEHGHLHVHRSLGFDTMKPYAGMGNRHSVRHSWFHSESAYAFGMTTTDATTDGNNHVGGGMLVQQNVIVGLGARAIQMWAYAGDIDYLTNPYQFLGNTLESHGHTANGNIFSRGTTPADWVMVASDNQMYTDSPANAINIDSDVTGMDALNNDYGSGNTAVAAGTHNFTVAGREFKIENGVITEIGA